jgi:hypothetical protein
MLELHLSEIDRLGAMLDRFLAFARPEALALKACIAGRNFHVPGDLIHALP